jgi:hypothetical protein
VRIAVHKVGESPPITRRNRPGLSDDPFFVLLFTLLVVLASSTSGDQHFYEIVIFYRPAPHRDWGRAKAAGNRFARDDKELGPQLGKIITRRPAS